MTIRKIIEKLAKVAEKYEEDESYGHQLDKPLKLSYKWGYGDGDIENNGCEYVDIIDIDATLFDTYDPTIELNLECTSGLTIEIFLTPDDEEDEILATIDGLSFARYYTEIDYERADNTDIFLDIKKSDFVKLAKKIIRKSR